MESQSQSRLVQLADKISSSTKIYDDYIRSQGLPSPSFDTDSPSELELPHDIAQANNTILEASAELQALMMGPLGIIQSQIREHNALIGLQAINRFNIATSFPVDGEASFEQISQACGLSEPQLRRILRSAITKYIFKEPRTGIVAHTAASKALAQLPLMRDFVGMVCDEMWPSAARTVDALVKWPGSEEPNHSGFAFANNTTNAIFKELGNFPKRSARFANAMSMMNAGEGFEPTHLVNAYPWDTMDVKVFVDIGGSYGTMSVTLAQHVPSITCIIQELPEIVAAGNSKIPLELADRVRFMSHDFFTEQPVIGADVYYFRWIFHDWSDKYCIKILQSLIPALRKGSRVVINELVLPPPGAVPAYQEWQIRSFDLAMLELLNSKERQVEDWAALFEHADPRFDFVGVTTPSGSKLSFMEAKWQGTESS